MTRREPPPSPPARSRAVWLVLCLWMLAALACAPRDPKPSKAEAVQSGDELAVKKQYAAAISSYLIAVDHDASDGEVRLKLARAYEADARWVDATREAVRAAELLPKNLDAQILAATRLLGTGEYDEAILRASDLLRDHPEDVNVIILWSNATARLLNSTWALYRLPDTVRSADDVDLARRELRPAVPAVEDEAAEDAFRKALRLAPASMDAQIALVNFLWAAGRVDEAEPMLRSLADRHPGHAAINYALGAFYRWRNQAADAEPYLKNAAAAGQWGRSARFALADMYIDGKRDADALAILTSMPAADDESGAISLRAAPIEFRLGKRDDARRRIDALLAREPHNPRGLLIKAQFLLDRRQPGEALKFARAAVAGAPQSSEARSTLGAAWFATGDLERAFDEYAEAERLGPGSPQPPAQLARLALALGRDKVALVYAREAVRYFPDDPGIVLFLIKALIRNGDIAAAERELKPLAARFPESPDVLTQVGSVHAARGDAAASRAAFTRALAGAPDSFDALIGIIELDLRDHSTRDARQRIDAALARHPDSVPHLLLASRVYGAEHDDQRMEATLRRALAIDPANTEGVRSLADSLVRQGRLAEAKELLERLLDRKPASVEAATALALLRERMGDIAGARRGYEEIVALDPRAAAASHRLAALYVQQGRLDAALSLAVVAKQELPRDAAVSDLIGWIYFRKGLRAFALPHLEDAVRAQPDNALYRFHLGSAYLSYGDHARARAELTGALAKDPNLAEARTALASIPQQ